MVNASALILWLYDGGYMDFGTYGSATEHDRYLDAVEPGSRRRCHCGCKKRATHIGMANGVGLITGCELSIRRWVRDGLKARTVGV